MGTKRHLLTRWCLVLGFLGLMGTYTHFPVNEALAAEPSSLEARETNDEPLPPEWTKKDCYDAWKYNMMMCNASPPNLRPACWAAASALLAACLGTAQ